MDKQQGPTVQNRELIQYPVINHSGKQYEEYIYIYTHTHISEPLCCTAEINTTL